MRCLKVQRKLSAYLDGELKEKEKGIISFHLNQCPDCQEEFTTLTGQDSIFQKAEAIEPSPYFRTKFWEKVRTAEEPTQVILLKLPILKWIPVPVVCSVIVFLFLFVSVLTPFLYGLDSKNKQDLIHLTAKTFFCFSPQKVFAPLNFISYCDRYCELLCRCSEGKCVCGKCEHKEKE